jgi:hypothetical protein
MYPNFVVDLNVYEVCSNSHEIAEHLLKFIL